MRILASVLLFAATTVFLCHAAVAEEKCKAVNLFNGECLEGWEYFVIDPDVKTEDVWSVKDGLLVCKGEPLGYLRTKEKYTNFKLALEWRWAPGKKPGNSGVLLRIDGDPVSFLPKCVEAQLMSGSAGDIWAFYGAKCAGDADRFKEIKNHEKIGDFMGVGRAKGAEKEPGQWNTYDITFDKGDLTLKINGQEVNKATDCDVIAGYIGMQSEGGEIHFRNIKLTELPCE